MDVAGTCLPTNSCGAGTKVDPATGACVPDGSVVCTDGTILDVATGTCVIDPTSCQDGTVLIGDACVDPTRGLVVDLDEGATEPNGLGVIEASSEPAGTIQLKTIGQPFVIHGKIAPFRDLDGDGQLDPDVDSYRLAVAQPTLLEISADGVGGIDGGFVAIAQVASDSPLVSWSRFGIDLSRDTSKRQLFLPAAGSYVLAIADTRTLYPYATGGPPDAAPGPGDYYVSITQLALPTPTALVPSGNVASHSGTTAGDVQLFTMPMGSGVNEIRLAIPTVQASPAIDSLAGSTLREVVFAAAGGTADMFVAGFSAADTPLIAVDDVYNYAVQPASYTLTVRTSDAQPLAGTATQTETAFDPADPLTWQQYYLDVAGADQTLGLAVTWNAAVAGSLYDGNLRVIGQFTPIAGTTTWSSYAGLVRIAQPGRYYLFVRDPAGTPGTSQLVATSQLAAIAPTALAEGIASGTQTVDPAFHANAFGYQKGTDAWQTFDSTGSGTGGQHVRWIDPARAYGRLDELATSAGTAPAMNGASAIAPVLEHTYGTAGGAIGRVLIDDPAAYYIVVDTPNAAGTFDLTCAARTFVDFGPLAQGAQMTSPDHVIAPGTPAGYFVFRTTVGASATIATHPHDSSQLETQFQRVNADESALGPLVQVGTGDATETFVQAGTGWTAFVVTALFTSASPQPYDVTVTIAP